MKKFFVLALVLVTAVVLVGCERDTRTRLIVGTPDMNGDFATGFGTSAYDGMGRDLIHGYGTLVETRDGAYIWDTVATLDSEPTVVDDEDENRTYTFKLQEDLLFSDGSEVTAADYVGAMMLRSTAEWAGIAQTATAGFYLLGYGAYNGAGADDGTSVDVPFEGVRLLGDYEFSFTISAAHLPYFWETTMVSMAPIHFPSYAPGYAVADDGEGAYITKVDADAGTLREVLDEAVAASDGQRYFPNPTTGPYKLVSFRNQIAIFEINEYFKYDFEENSPQIEVVEMRAIAQDTDVDQVIAGTVDIVEGVIEGEKIDAALAADTVGTVSFPRSGYGMIAFMSYYGPTQHAEVRNALGFLFDRNQFLSEIIGGYGTLVNGPYGEGQWFYQETRSQLDDLLTDFVLDPAKANEYLDNSPYVYEADGTTPFDVENVSETGEYFRHDADGNPLFVNHAGTENNDITVLINLQLSNNAWQAGIDFNVDEVTFDVLIDHYFYASALEPEERTYHSFNLATGFSSAYDPYWSWHSDYAGTTANPTGIADDDLDEIIERMNRWEPDQRDEWKQSFVEFIVKWNELLPTFPLYSNQIYDIHTNRVQGLSTGPTWTWANDINTLSIAE